MTLHTRLQRRPHGGIYYCRVAIPKALQSIIGKREIHTSLKTCDAAIARELVKVESIKIDRMIAELSGKVVLPVPESVMYKPINQSSLPQQQQLSPTFGELVKTFFNLPEKHTLGEKTKLEYRVIFRILAGFLGDNTPISTITRADCRRVQDAFTFLPPNCTKSFPKLTMPEIVERAKKEGLQPMTVKSANNYLSRLSALFNWAQREGIVIHNPAKGLLLSDKEAARDKRLPFSSEQLNLIFDNPVMQSYKEQGAAQYWIPMLSLWTGARLNELCQLHVEDIVKRNDICCLLITDGEGKRLKTRNSRRIIPLHPQLLAFGFLEYVADMQKRGSKRLFPNLTVNKYGMANDRFSKWFASYLADVGAKTKKTCFHSFRHCFRDALREAGIERGIVQALGGWSRRFKCEVHINNCVSGQVR